MKQSIVRKEREYLHCQEFTKYRRKVFRYILLIACFFPLHVWAQTVTLKVKNQSVKKVFDEITKQTGYTFFYDETLLKKAKPVTAEIKNASLKEAMEEICVHQPFTYSIESKIIIITLIATRKTDPHADSTDLSPQQELTVTGRVFNRQALPLAGATITVRGKGRGGKTNEDGRYSITADANDQLIITYVNFRPENISIKGRKVIDVVMEPNISAMDEVTVSTGYQKIEQKYLTGSVTSLRMDSIYQPGITSVDRMLEGRVPGMIMMQNSGQAGAAPKLRIRGTSTIMGTREPLWVVDGIALTDPVSIDPNRLNDLDFVNLVGNAIAGLNPNDIDKIEVLKDATATSMYGVRAANGVISVTTKRGKSGPPTVSYSNNVTFTRRPRYSDNDVFMMNSRERVEVSKEMFDRQIPIKGIPEAYEKATMDYYNGVIDYDTYMQQVNRAKTINTDWLGAVTQDVLSSNQTLGISGGNPQSTYYASIGYTNERGVIKGEFNKRYTGLFNLNLNYRNFQARFSVAANKNDRRYTPSDLRILDYGYGTSRAIPIYTEKDSLYFYHNTIQGVASLNPSFNVLNEMNHSGQTLAGNSYMLTGNFNYQLLPGLQLEALLSYTSSNTEQRNWFDEQTNRADNIRGPVAQLLTSTLPFGGELLQQNDQQQSYTVRGNANFNHFLDERKKHLLNIMLGGEMNSAKSSALKQTRRGYYPERGHSFAQIDLNTYTGYATWLGDFGQATITEGLNNTVGLLAAASYIYDERYIVTLNARSDFSNAFGDRSNERFLPTWAISGRWNIDKDILKNQPWVDMAALRISYGTQGNMLAGQTPYAIIQKGEFNSSYQAYSSTIAHFPNPFLKWEKTDSYNAGLDFSFFKGRLNGTVEFFYKKTSNAFLTRTVSLVNGLDAYTINAGNLENKGVELRFNFTPVSNAKSGGKKGFTWRIDPQLGQVFNKLIDHALGNERKAMITDPNTIDYASYLSGAVPVNGKSVNTFYAYRFKALDNNGLPVFYGAEPENAAALEARYGKMNREEVFREVMVEAGRREPVLQGGISNYLGYGNWSINFNFTYSLGNKIRLLQITSGNYGSYQPTSQQNLRKEYLNRWRFPGDEQKTNIPGLYPLENTPTKWWSGNTFAADYYQMYDNSDLRVVKADYLKLQYIAINYKCPQEICKRYRMKGAWISLSGTNLFTLASKKLQGQDPTQSGSSPNINMGLRPVYTVAINVSF
ncbi:TonB-linked SusC/RagA family outer membrane protein [Pseudobacter ginsenosidimutans]|uniref:TonB-linked SusC/RagA family outer membrane protein n=2 Tax=Pseudobacter ginsenosidimutans TaxID=661488 RepID=A0A4Q7MZT1_9BACT|nr:TonB-linked SusC/RagA family outer membrane protein [Pseudobacter ginsenosidimutans]